MIELRLIDRCGRVLTFEPVSGDVGLKCADCAAPAHYATTTLMVGAERELLTGNRKFYCGTCQEE